MKAVIYARVSTLDQGIDRQIDDLNKWATYKNLQVVKTFQDKISGFKKGFEDRESWNEMMEFIEKENIRHIMVSELSRLSRRQVDLIVFVSECSKKQICIHVQKENLTTLNPDGTENANAQMLISIISSMAQQESTSLSYRIKSGRRNAIEKGKGFNTKIYGYKPDDNGKPVIDENEAKIVREIFKLACDGFGSPSIINALNKDSEYIWKKGRVSSILKNTFYYGKMEYKGQSYDVPAIISKQTFDTANDFRKSRKRFISERKHTNPFSGLIKCQCGAKMYQIVVHKTNVYRCKAKCGMKSVNRPFLIDEVRIVAEKNAKLSKQEGVRQRMNNEVMVESSNIIAYEKQIIKANSMRDRNYELYLEQKITEELYNKYNDKYTVQIQNLYTQLEKSKTSVRNVKNTLKNEVLNYSKDLDVFKKQMIKSLEWIEIRDEFAVVKLKGWGKQIIMLYRGNDLVKYYQTKT